MVHVKSLVVKKYYVGLIRACEKRPVPLETVRGNCVYIEKDLRRIGNAEVRSEDVGEMVMDHLRKSMKLPMYDLPLFIVNLKILMYLLMN